MHRFIRFSVVISSGTFCKDIPDHVHVHVELREVPGLGLWVDSLVRL